jgi:ankyrin repeat protein
LPFSNPQFAADVRLSVNPLSKKPFLPSIAGATPLIYAILCEQLDTVLYLLLRLRASLSKGIVSFSIYNGVCFVFIGFLSILQRLCRIITSS